MIGTRLSRAAAILSSASVLLSGCIRSGYELIDLAPADPAPADLAPADLAPADLESGDVDSSAATVLTLSEEGRTAHTLSVRWDASALSEEIEGYAMWYGPNAEEVAGRTGSARCWDESFDPNLAWRYSERGPNLVTRTTVSDLQPSATYYLELDARVAATWTTVARGVAGTATAPRSCLSIFDEVLPPGAWTVAFSLLESNTAHGGEYLLQYEGDGAWVNAILGGLHVDASDVVADAPGAHLLVFVRITPQQPVYYLSVGLAGADRVVYNQAGQLYSTLRATDGWQRLEVPLSALVNGESSLSEAGFQQEISWFRIGFTTPVGTAVQLDDLQICY